MDIYHIWCDLKPGVSDMEFSDNIGTYLGGFHQSELIPDPVRQQGAEKF
ncbi:MAG: hypothetical protein QGI63_01750 [Rhodospirillales bacterium]|jgi:hypothetical protein|nr:hypothetical protein [Rhodospirillales bacterium]MDP6772969.1 hypothetical protein [Rhodospirillales bacterium]|tara:strand:- start:244 stop:390 length:147 start_codon:yes stop_codon:yes gene_type:complete